MVDLFAFDLAMPSRQPPERGTRMMQSGGGRIDGVVQWLRLDLAPGITYKNAPNGAWSNGGCAFTASTIPSRRRPAMSSP
ncbi:MAG: hypothetical protein C0500_00925 [Sphingobium sp.]|nr:hypothetical protein [Sphingobium sp.]